MGFLGKILGPKIGKLKDRGDVEALETILASDTKSEHRVDAIKALVELEGASIPEALAAALNDAEPAVDRAAEEALRSLGANAAEALAASLARPIGDRALSLLLDLGDASAEPLQNAAQHDDETARRRAISGLLDLARTSGEDATRELCFRTVLASLGDKAPTCRAEAAAGLAAFGDPRAAKALAAQLKDGDESVRAACRSTLSEIGPPAVPCLVDALADRNPNSRLLAAGLLAEIDTTPVEVQDRQAVLVTLIELLDSKDEVLAGAVNTAVERIPVADVIDMQLERLEDPNSDKREESERLVRQLLEHGAIGPHERQEADRRLIGILAATMNAGDEDIDS
jgi:HEAT repeat protein